MESDSANKVTETHKTLPRVTPAQTHDESKMTKAGKASSQEVRH